MFEFIYYNLIFDHHQKHVSSLLAGIQLYKMTGLGLSEVIIQLWSTYLPNLYENGFDVYWLQKGVMCPMLVYQVTVNI